MKPLSSAEVRTLFLEYFRERGHRVVSSSPLVPEEDPTLLFTNAGMVQFKNAFLGLEERPYNRATSAQKCLRVSGKHNDLEEVGPSPRHHTFFEMLGNFSFGDYFKREAVQFAWEFLTETLGMPQERFQFTVYKDDEESFALWQEVTGFPPEKVHRLGEKSNFWMMGETGPCGPNSELMWDRGQEYCSCGRADCSPALDNDCDRWWEVWNLVFMQYEQRGDGSRADLPKPGVDTGMGFERLVAILQGAETNYDTDLFQPIMHRISEMLGHIEVPGSRFQVPGSEPANLRTWNLEPQLVAYRVLADHSRAIAFLLADNVLPGNEGRSYVLRMIMRRAIRFGKQLGFDEPFLGELATTVIDIMGGHYTELIERKDFILKAIQQEEERFERVLDGVLPKVYAYIVELKTQGKTTIPGSIAFTWHDRDGLHIEIIEDIAQEEGVAVDRAGFEREMERQKERSASATIGGRAVITVEDIRLPPPFERTFLGYSADRSSLETETALFNLLVRSDSKLIEVQSLSEGEEGYFLFTESPFYAEGGGQVGDQGVIINLTRTGRAEVEHVEKYGPGVALHKAKVLQGQFQVQWEDGRPHGDRCQLQVDIERRKKIMRHHTATHLLHASLRQVLGYKQGIQAGSLVAPEELRFDFTHLARLSEEELNKVEQLMNEAVLQDLPVTIAYESLEKAKNKGAIALFAEDYQGKEKVRVVTTGDPDEPFSRELCGGTHVGRTGQIGLIKIVSEEGIAAGVRRVRAVAGTESLRLLGNLQEMLEKAAALLGASQRDLLAKLSGLLEEREQLAEEFKVLQDELLSRSRDELLPSAERFDGVSLVAAKVELDGEELKRLADLLEEKLDRGIVLLGSANRGRAVLVCKVSDALTDRFNAGEIIQHVATIIGGNGGGSSRFAQGGGGHPDRLDRALEEGARFIKSGLA